MSFTHQITRAINDGVASNSFAENVTSGTALMLSELIPTNQTNLAVAFAFTKAKLKSIVIWADAAMTVCTNDISGGSPQETIVLAANRPFEWSVTDPLVANPFAGNVTGLYVTTGGTAGTLNIRGVVDPT